MKKLLVLLMVLLLSGCASNNTIKINENALKDLSVDGNYTVYFQMYLQGYDGKGNLIKNNEKTDSTFTYPAVFTDDMDPQSMEFTTEKNELFKEMIQEFVDLKDNLKQVEELSFNENNLAIYFKNLHALFRALCQSSTSASLESRTFMLFSLTFFASVPAVWPTIDDFNLEEKICKGVFEFFSKFCIQTQNQN